MRGREVRCFNEEPLWNINTLASSYERPLASIHDAMVPSPEDTIS